MVNHKDAAPAVLRNDTKSDNHWIRFVLQGTKSNRDAIGAKLEVTVLSPGQGPGEHGKRESETAKREATTGERTIYRQRKGGYSMEATNDPRVLIGVGPVTEVKNVQINWPSGRQSTLEDLKVDQTYTIVEPVTGDAPRGQPKPAG